MQNVSGVSLSDIGVYGNDLKTNKLNGNQNSFESLFQSAIDMVNETNTLTNKAEEEEMRYAMGSSTSIHELQVAQQKANLSLQYTVAVRNALLDSYKEIINMQF